MVEVYRLPYSPITLSPFFVAISDCSLIDANDWDRSDGSYRFSRSGSFSALRVNLDAS